MLKATRSAARLLAILTVPAWLAACSILQPGGNEPPTPALRSFAENVPRVDNSPASPCWQQEQIAAQNAYLEAIIRGAPRPYIAPCKAKAKPAAVSEPKTS